MRPRALARFAALLALGLLAAWTVRSSAAPPEKADATLRLGVIAEEPNEPDRMFKVFADFLGELRRRLAPSGIAVGELVIARDLDDLSQRLSARGVDMVLETVFPLLALRERSRNLEPALLVVRRGEREYRSVFFTRKDSPIQELADLRGRTLVLQALRSTSAFALPRAELLRSGLRLLPADDTALDASAVRYVLALAEVNQAVWVLHDKGDAGAFNEGDWHALPEKVRAQLRIFKRTRSLPRGLIAIRADLDPKVRRALEDVLVSLHHDEPGRAALAKAQGVTRFERLTPAEQRSVLAWGSFLMRAR
jgi:phosphonate transport system substrate-binding protein